MNKNIFDCISNYNTIATVGICKNAGKTTTLNFLVEKFKENYSIGITSIGYDGEEKDLVTTLPKPRIRVHNGMVIAATKSCIDNTSIKYCTLKNSGIMTALGEVIIIKSLSEGIIELAGPSISSQIGSICNMISGFGADKIIIDGAAGRLSYSHYTDSTILSVGAALSNDMDTVVKRAQHTIELLSLKKAKNSIADVDYGKFPYIAVVDGDTCNIWFRGSMVDKDMQSIMRKYKSLKKRVTIKDAGAAFISPKTLKRFKLEGGEILVLNPINLVAVTINPMSPYGQWFDKDEFMDKMQKGICLPVFNIKDYEA